ncbi:PREDICTED: transmembrane protein 245 isoform X2 [Ceratosolen solmsi marchali]|uniref:Transmembrane protein 245 isoform X2 n=1 Tax=Ceratosolen solmsi marchali TaxID=326594 RepID=A0AAJ6YIA0_9HYME|nr:PREDICTED: transmembrane protein 245 isoform X2 [Ceratosolen solmsi marchali]
MDIPKTPMENLLNMLSGLSAGHEKALKQGIYNAVALFLLCLVSAAGYGLCIVLSPFLKPLIWALLCGSVLFPVKSSLTTIVQSWFAATEKSNKLFLLSLSIVPVNIFDKLSEFVGSFLQKYLRYILSIFSSLIGISIVYKYLPNIIYCLIWRLFMIVNIILNFFISMCNIYLMATVTLGYLSVLYFFWTPANSTRFYRSSFIMWLIISLFISNALGAYQVFIFCSLQILFLVGFIYEVILILDHHEMNGKRTSFINVVKSAFNNIDESITNTTKMPTLLEDESLITEDESVTKKSAIKEANDLAIKPFLKTIGRSFSMDPNVRKSSEDHLTRRVCSTSNITSDKISITDRYVLKKLRAELRMSLDIEVNNVDTDKYMYGAMYACIGMILWKHKWIAIILIMPMAYFYLKKFSSYFGIGNGVLKQCRRAIDLISLWCQERHQALIPISMRGLFKVIIIIDRKMTQILKESVDSVATTAVILGLIVFVLCTSVFITIQIYTEGMHLIQISGEILNSTLMNHPDIDWVPQQWEESVNSVLDNAYVYGRTAISDGIRKFVKDLEPAKAEQMEKKVLELWDRLYQAWMMSNDNPNMIGPSVDVNAAFSVWESLTESIGKSPLQLFNMTSIQNFAKENVGILMSVLDSIWGIIKGNMSVILSLITELMYIVLMSGSVVLNFALSMIVFFTALFYLLNSSGKTYKPIELITNFSPISCHRFATSLQEAIIGVFTATFKLASFFGMWTWFIHNLFQVKFIYLPTVLATLLGAVPFLDAYFACLPATIELWFTQGRFIAIVFFLFHFLPCNIVVSEFYKEIKGGGHPYLTGLSIAGGVFCLGIEGAIFGPLLLCCIMVAINLSRRYLQSPSEEAINSIKSQIDRLES